MSKVINLKSVGILTPEEVEHLKHWKKTSIKAKLEFLESTLKLGKKVEERKR